MANFFIEDNKCTFGYFTIKYEKELLVVYVEECPSLMSLTHLFVSGIEEVLNKCINRSHILWCPFKITKLLSSITPQKISI